MFFKAQICFSKRKKRKKNEKKLFLKLKLISNETLSYYHEYFHHVTDTWKVKHGLCDEELSKNYNRIWINEDQMKEGYKDGILLGETLADL